MVEVFPTDAGRERAWGTRLEAAVARVKWGRLSWHRLWQQGSRAVEGLLRWVAVSKERVLLLVLEHQLKELVLLWSQARSIRLPVIVHFEILRKQSLYIRRVEMG